MKLLKFWLNGRPRTHDGLKALQEQTAMIEEQFSGLGAFIFKGCQVTPNGSKFDIAPGLVMIDNKLLRFEGAVSIDLPIELYAADPVESDARPDSNGIARNAMVEYKAAWRPEPDNGDEDGNLPGGGGT